MEFTSYQIVSNNTASLNTGSYLNLVEYSMFVRGYVGDVWYGFSANDAIELGVWDLDNNLVGWQILNQSKSYNEISLSYTNTLNFPVGYSYKELKPDFTLYKNEKILVNPPEQLSSSFGILSGSYILTYNFTREMAGTSNNPLVIKDISPSRKELKLVPLNSSTLQYDTFCQKKVLISDIASLYILSLKDCPYSQIYSQISSLYSNEIATLRTLFFLVSDDATVQFFKNLYEDFIKYIVSSNGNSNLIRIQGIQTYFNNFLLSNANSIISFDDIDTYFVGVVSAIIERKFAPIGPSPSQKYIDAKAFVYDFFTKYYSYNKRTRLYYFRIK